MNPACSVPSTAAPPAKAPLIAFAVTATIAPTPILSRCRAQVCKKKKENLTVHCPLRIHPQNLWFQVWAFWQIHISHRHAEEPRVQRTVVVCVAPNRETLSELSLTRTWRWHAHSVSVHRSDPTHRDGCPSSTSHSPYSKTEQRLLGQGAPLCGGAATENGPGPDSLLSCQWSCLNLNLNLRPTRRLIEREKSEEGHRPWAREEGKSAGRTCAEEWSKMRKSLRGTGSGCVYVEEDSELMQRVWSD